MRRAQRLLAPQDPESVLNEIVYKLLEREAGPPASGWEQAERHIRSGIDREKDELLKEAQPDYLTFERLRAEAGDRYWRVYPLAYVFSAALIAYLVTASTGQYFIPAGDIPGIGFIPWVAILLLLAAIAAWLLWWRRRTILMRDARQACGKWRSTLQDQVLRPFIVENRNEQARNPFDLHIRADFLPRVFEESDPLRPVETEAMISLRETARNVHAGSLGISGPRGAGKTRILKSFGTGAAVDDGNTFGLAVSAPVDYEPREFIIYLFRQLCETVLKNLSGSGPVFKEETQRGLERESRRYLEQCKYRRTYTKKSSASATLKSLLTFAREYALERAEQPVTLPEWADSFRDYARQVSDATEDGWRLVICIDEVDKIRDSDRAEAFLNDIKAVFDIPGCLYLVSLSEDAMSSFARRTPTIRSSFDSAFDELVPVGPMTYQHSEEMLLKRATGVPRPFIALCYVLAGGLPRDLVRTIRALAYVAHASVGMSLEHEMSLEQMASKLIRRELDSLRRASARQFAENAGPAPLLEALHDRDWPGSVPGEFIKAAEQVSAAARDVSDSNRQLCQDLVVSLSFYATAWEVFAAGGSRGDELVACLKSQGRSQIDDLAAARYALWENAGLAHRLLERYRSKYGIGEADGNR